MMLIEKDRKRGERERVVGVRVRRLERRIGRLGRSFLRRLSEFFFFLVLVSCLCLEFGGEGWEDVGRREEGKLRKMR
jgi:hypothetical protein